MDARERFTCGVTRRIQSRRECSVNCESVRVQAEMSPTLGKGVQSATAFFNKSLLNITFKILLLYFVPCTSGGDLEKDAKARRNQNYLG